MVGRAGGSRRGGAGGPAFSGASCSLIFTGSRQWGGGGSLWAPSALSPGDWDLKREELSPGRGACSDPTPAPDHHISSCAPLRPEPLSWTAGKNRFFSLPASASLDGGRYGPGGRLPLGLPGGWAGAADGEEGRRRARGHLANSPSAAAGGPPAWLPCGHRGRGHSDPGPGCPIPTAPRAAHPVLRPASPRPPLPPRPVGRCGCRRPYL